MISPGNSSLNPPGNKRRTTLRAGSARTTHENHTTAFRRATSGTERTPIGDGKSGRDDDREERQRAGRKERNAGAGGVRPRGGDGSALHRDRSALFYASGPSTADGRRPPLHRGGHQDQQRHRADRRPGGQHRPGGL